MNFEYFKKLYEDNPEMAERIRRRIMELVIASRPEKVRWKLTGLQNEINKKRGKSPLRNFEIIKGMMWCSFNDMRSELNNLSNNKMGLKNDR